MLKVSQLDSCLVTIAQLGSFLLKQSIVNPVANREEDKQDWEQES